MKKYAFLTMTIGFLLADIIFCQSPQLAQAKTNYQIVKRSYMANVAYHPRNPGKTVTFGKRLIIQKLAIILKITPTQRGKFHVNT